MNKTGVSRFSVRNFSSTIPQDFVGETFWISEILSIEKIYVGGGITILPQTLCITRGEGTRVTIFHGKNFVPQYRKTPLGNPLLFQKVSGMVKEYE